MNLIFDFDGTICDSLDITIGIINKLLDKRGLKHITKAEMREGGFKGLVKNREIPKAYIPALVFYGNREIAKHISKLTTFPHLKQVLIKLSKDNNLSIVTSNSSKNVKLFLKNNGLEKIFGNIESDFSMFGKEKKINRIIKRHKLERDETNLIGDETRDVEAARKAHIHAISVSWGFESKLSLKKASPDQIVDTPDELLKLL